MPVNDPSAYPSRAWRPAFQWLQEGFQRAAELHLNLNYLIVQDIDRVGSLPPKLQRRIAAAGGHLSGEIRGRWDGEPKDAGDDFWVYINPGHQEKRKMLREIREKLKRFPACECPRALAAISCWLVF